MGRGSQRVGGELELIALIRERAAALPPAPGRELRLGIGDDCAILRPRQGEELVVTTDFSLEGRHFRLDWHPAASVGHRTLARGLSDLAAMGARPVAAFLSLALPRRAARNRRWIEQFLDGLLGLARETRVPLAGGDTAEAPGEEILADIVLMGAVPAGTALRRDGARAGDGIYVSGALGGAAAELRMLGQRRRRQRGAREGSPQLYPEPRLQLGQALRRRGLATAAMDISDGLSTDLRHLCEASGTAARVELGVLPLHPLAVRAEAEEALRLALHGGEDYELLFTAAAATRVPRALGGVPVTRIGTMVRWRPGQPRVVGVSADAAERPIEAGGWEHLR